MKASKRALFVCLALVTVLCVAASSGIPAQQQQHCVTCGVSNGVFVCQGAAAGGQTCETFSTGCTVYTPCTTTKGPKKVGTEVPLDPNFYRAVAAQKPRLAASLLLYTRGKTELSDGEVHWMPFEMTQTDVGQMLRSTQNLRSVLLQAASRVRRDLPPIVHTVAVEESPDGSEITLMLKAAVSELEPVQSVLTVKLTLAIGPTANQAARITSWEIN